MAPNAIPRQRVVTVLARSRHVINYPTLGYELIVADKAGTTAILFSGR